MPLITIEGPQLSKEQKRQLVETFTKVASDVTKIPEQGFVVLIKENNQDNVGVGGTLLSDREK
jgi:4-oxalocrotonate tautomerase